MLFAATPVLSVCSLASNAHVTCSSCTWPGSLLSTCTTLPTKQVTLWADVGDMKPSVRSLQVVYLDDVLLAHHLEPAEGPGTIGLIELCFSLPATASSAVLRVNFQKAFLTVFDHPPDAHRGFDIPAALLTFRDASSEHQVSMFWDVAAVLATIHTWSGAADAL